MMELIYLLQDDPGTTSGILRDEIWQFWGFVAGAAGVLIALVALIAFLVQWRRSAKKPDLRYAVETYSMLNPSTQKVLGQDANQLPNVRLFVGDSQMENPKLVTIRVVNAGRREIRKEDFDGPLLLDMGEDSGLVPGIVSVDSNRSGIAETLQQSITWSNPNRIQIAPMLLNSGDQFDLGFILEKADVELTGRIAGVDEVKRSSASELYDVDGVFLNLGRGLFWGIVLFVIPVLLIYLFYAWRYSVRIAATTGESVFSAFFWNFGADLPIILFVISVPLLSSSMYILAQDWRRSIR